MLLIDDSSQVHSLVFAQVSSAKELQARLGCAEKTGVKVVAIFGNVGDGKSYTLNASFFGGAPVFATSHKPDSCTVGVWAALTSTSVQPTTSQTPNPASADANANARLATPPAADDQTALLCLDTEGLFGANNNQLQRLRLLLKVRSTRHASTPLSRDALRVAMRRAALRLLCCVP